MTKMQQVIPGGSEFSFHRLYLSPDDPGGGSESDNDSDDGSSDDDSNGDSDQGDGDSGSSSEDEGDSGIRMNITKEDLDKRLERASKRQVKALAKSFGFNDPEEFKKNVEAWKKADAEAKKKADAEKSDLEKAQARLAELEAADKAKGAEVAKLKLTIEIKDAAAKSGVKDPEIAEALYLKHRQDKGDEAQDPDEFYRS